MEGLSNGITTKLMDNWFKLRINTKFNIVYNVGDNNMNDIVNIISTVGFPISSCILYMFYIYKDKQQSREENAKREEKLMEQISRFNEIMNNFNDTLISLDKRIEHIENNLKE